MLDRRSFAGTLLAAPWARAAPLEESHFPDRLHQFVWRNWELANLDRMAAAVNARPRELEAIGRRMGLPPKPVLTGDQLRRIYITVIRENWRLLPHEQMLALLGWSREKLDFTLKEDDFLDVKLGPKPACVPVVYKPPTPDTQRRAVEAVALRRFGPDRAKAAVDAWRGFSEAFEEFPYGVDIYLIPTQHGPANLLRPRPTGIAASMILFPQDDLKRWCGPYPSSAVLGQFRKLTEKWEAALGLYREAVSGEDLAIAEACGLHFRSTANQVEFYLLRDSGGNRDRMRDLARDEIECARRLFALARRYSVIGYEASNHYYYRPTHLAEKILNCRYLLEHDLSR